MTKISVRLFLMNDSEGLKNLPQGIAISVTILLCMLLILLSGLSGAPQKNWGDWGRHEKQYEELTQALVSGQLSLPEEPAAFLSEMENPYDPAARTIAGDEAGAYALIDTAYYNGKYYVYFGVTPALLLYLPAYLLTHRILPTWIAVIATAVLLVPVIFLFIRCLCRRYAPRTPFSIRLLLSVSLTGILGVPYLAAFCTTYSMPAVMGLFLTLLGLSCFLTAERPDGSLRRTSLIAGSVLLGLTIGCRPVFAASYLLLFPLYAEEIRRGAFFRRKKEALTNTVSVLLPALLTGTFFLIYNALRFGNPLEFGFHYLFTTRDLLHGSHSFGETLAGMQLLSLNPPRIHRVFPFMEVVDYVGQYRESLYVEPMFGGLLPLHPLLIAGLLIGLLSVPFLLKSKTGPSSWTLLHGLSLFLGVLILYVDAGIAGISQRYESDFALFFFLPAAMPFLLIFADTQADKNRIRRNRRILTILLILLTLAELFLSFAAILCDGRYFAMRDWNPDAYNRIASVFHLLMR